mmetsp:Transcript_29503/g.33933  ORF Transcript_29503/g.33933 Transcript_29503/m.33933 type:complete len:80 (-) Transcript_29503:40-279(-)
MSSKSKGPFMREINKRVPFVRLAQNEIWPVNFGGNGSFSNHRAYLKHVSTSEGGEHHDILCMRNAFCHFGPHAKKTGEN